MTTPTTITKLHLNKPTIVFGVPVFVYLCVVAVSVLIAVAMMRFGVDTFDPNVQQGFRNNGGAIWSVAGFFVYLGVQAVASTFPLPCRWGPRGVRTSVEPQRTSSFKALLLGRLHSPWAASKKPQIIGGRAPTSLMSTFLARVTACDSLQSPQ